MGNNVTCVDIDREKVNRLCAGEMPIFEPGLDVFFKRSLREHRLHFTTNLDEAVSRSEVILLALPTPPDGDGAADLSYVLGVAQQISRLLAVYPESGYRIIANKSTVPVGTADRVRKIFEARCAGDDEAL